MFLRAKTVATLGSLLEVPCLRGTPDLLNQHFYQGLQIILTPRQKLRILGPDDDKTWIKTCLNLKKTPERTQLEMNMWK